MFKLFAFIIFSFGIEANIEVSDPVPYDQCIELKAKNSDIIAKLQEDERIVKIALYCYEVKK